MPSPPKPWERSGATPVTAAPPVTSAPISTAPSTATSTSIPSADPSVPARPASIASTSTPYTNPINNTLGSSYSSYTSPYSRFGTGYSPYSSYGSYGGGYGSSYGSYGMGGMPYGMSGLGMGLPGMPYDPNNPNAPPSLTSIAQNSTSQTFALLQSIVQTFSSFAQLLDSTFVATHSSFFAMIGVADQLGQLKNVFGQVLGIFGLVGWLRGWFKGERSGSVMRDDFKRFLRGAPSGGPDGAPRPSRKPLLFFLAAVIGLPYLMHRLIKSLSSRLPPPNAVNPQNSSQPIDPSQLTFARAIHAFHTTDAIELKLEKGEIVAVLNTADPVTGQEGEWWRGRTREGREGWFPKNFVEVIKVKRDPAMEEPKVEAVKTVE